MQRDTVTESIRKFVVSQFPTARNLSDEDALLDNGIIDSLGVLEVVSFLEREFDMTVSDEELLPENFGSVASLAKFVRSKMSGAS